jgi:uncharacterized protein (TIGR03437 family)
MDRGAVRGPADRGHGGDRGAGRSLPGSRPALRGEYIEIYATGLGQVSRLQRDGQAKPPTTTPAITALPAVTIGGVPASVTFSGRAPGAVGLFQINASGVLHARSVAQ